MKKRTVIISVIITAIASGITVGCLLFLSGDDGDKGHVEQKMVITISSEEDELIVDYRYDQRMDWGEHRILVSRIDDTSNRTELSAEGDQRTGYGDVLIFRDAKGEWDPEPGIEYNVKMVRRESNLIIWEDDIVSG
ncbi:MAG: hypothetical protein ACMUHU_03805 [Thermoplasmatota archaeon]